MTTKQLVIHRITTSSSILALLFILISEIADTCADLLIPNRKVRDDRDILIDRRSAAVKTQNRRFARSDRRHSRDFSTRSFFSVAQHERRMAGLGRRAGDLR